MYIYTSVISTLHDYLLQIYHLTFILSRAYWAADVMWIICSLTWNSANKCTVMGDLFVKTIVLISWYHVIRISNWYVTVPRRNQRLFHRIFHYIAPFKAPYLWTSIKGEAQMHFVNSLGSHSSMKLFIPPLMKVLCVVMWSKYVMITCHISFITATTELLLKAGLILAL